MIWKIVFYSCIFLAPNTSNLFRNKNDYLYKKTLLHFRRTHHELVLYGQWRCPAMTSHVVTSRRCRQPVGTPAIDGKSALASISAFRALPYLLDQERTLAINTVSVPYLLMFSIFTPVYPCDSSITDSPPQQIHAPLLVLSMSTSEKSGSVTRDASFGASLASHPWLVRTSPGSTCLFFRLYDQYERDVSAHVAQIL